MPAPIWTAIAASRPVSRRAPQPCWRPAHTEACACARRASQPFTCTKEVVAYEGNRSLEDMVEFVALHSGEAAPAAAAAPGAPGIESAGADGDEEDAKDEL